MKREDIPLRVHVRFGVLTIEIGVDTLAHACLRSDYAYELLEDRDLIDNRRPDARFAITDPARFAVDVKRELIAELGEDGSSLLTNVIDAACRSAIEQGSEWFADREDEP